MDPFMAVAAGWLALTVFGAVAVLAWRTSVAMWPLDTSFPAWMEKSLPVRGRWLAIALRGATFPFVLLVYGVVGCMVLSMVGFALMLLVGMFNSS
jgi:hypothetical protein